MAAQSEEGGGAAVGGGVGTLVFPDVGTLGGGGGAVIGGIGGSGVGAFIGGGVGAGLGYLFCSGSDDAIPTEDAQPKNDCPDDPCAIQFENDYSVAESSLTPVHVPGVGPVRMNDMETAAPKGQSQN